jgi:hypothetical protein
LLLKSGNGKFNNYIVIGGSMLPVNQDYLLTEMTDFGSATLNISRFSYYCGEIYQSISKNVLVK